MLAEDSTTELHLKLSGLVSDYVLKGSPGLVGQVWPYILLT
jgi:hypothetical protein